MKQPTAPNLYPTLSEGPPTLPEDGYSYRLQKISEIERTLCNERDIRKSISKKYKRGINIADSADSLLITSSVVLAVVGITVPIALPLEIVAAVCGGLGVCVKFFRRRLTKKMKKHYSIQTIAESKMNSIKDIVSKAMEDNQISDTEFKMVLTEMEKFTTLRDHSKNLEISEVEKNKLIEQGRKEAMNTIQKSLSPG